MKYEALAGNHIDGVAAEAQKLCEQHQEPVTFDFNGVECAVFPNKTPEENRLTCRRALGLPDVDPPFHPQSALDALVRWDKGQSVFTIAMGGLGPGYEQAIQILVFELIRDLHDKPLPQPGEAGAAYWRTWADETISRIDNKIGGFTGAQVGAAKTLAHRAIRDGWEKMLVSAPKNRQIQVSKEFPHL